MSARLFVAVEVSEEDRLALSAWARDAVGEDQGMRLVDPAQVHLTLAFLGHRALEEIEPLGALAEGFAGTPAPVLRTGTALWLSPRRPHVLTVGVDDVTGTLGELHGRLWDGLEDLGFEREKRRFRPHLTVARVRHGWSAPRVRLPDVPDRALTPGAVVLFRSWLGGGPARYEALARAPFA
jgi:2'-5' RNA ligase